MRLFLIFFLAGFSIKAQVHLLDNWKSYDCPKSGESVTEYLYEENDWHVYLDKKGKICAVNHADFIDENEPSKLNDSVLKAIFRMFPAGNRTYLKISDGYLIGVENGELRGGMFWVSDDFKKGYQISSHKVLKVIKNEKQIFAIFSMPLPDASTGGICEIKSVNGRYVAGDFVQLASPPIDLLFDNENELIVLTSKPSEILKVKQNKEVVVLSANNFWDSLFPKNMLLYNESLYIGMNKGVVKFDLSNNKKGWLLPK